MTELTQVYACLCSDAGEESELPADCPHHGRPVSGRWPNHIPGGIDTAHACGKEHQERFNTYSETRRDGLWSVPEEAAS